MKQTQTEKSEEVAILHVLMETVMQAIASSRYPDLDPDTYFIWMYSVEPFAEA